MPAPVAPRSPDRRRRDATDPPDPGEDPDDPATERLQALLRSGEPWRDRLGDRVASVRLVTGPTRAAVAAAVAVVLGAGAFAVLGGGGGTTVDPVQVLPRADAAGAHPAPAAGPGGSAPGPTVEPLPAPGSGVPGTDAPGIVVHAAGAVLDPGIHPLPAQARVADLVAAAGGLTPDADPDRINLAAPLRDGERVYVPRRGELAVPEVVAGGAGPTTAEGPGGDPTSPAGPAARVDLNTADAAALEALPGIGPATAAAIVGHRTEHGPFASVDELQEVTGIGPAKLAQLRDLVRV